MMNDFYIVLPSNVYTPEYPNNSTSHYFTILPKTLHLTGQWELALTELSFPQSWHNVKKEISTITISTVTLKENKNIKIPHGYYQNVQKLLDTINRYLPKYINKFNYNPIKRKVSIILKAGQKITLHPLLAKIIGFENNVLSFFITEKLHKLKIDRAGALTDDSPAEILSDKPLINIHDRISDPIEKTETVYDEIITTHGSETLTITGKNSPDLCAGIYSLYVYCNIVTDSIIGNTQAPLLRTVDKDNSHILEYVTKHFHKRNYIKLKFQQINLIEISIRDDFNKLINFEFGKLVCTLHFRKQRFLS